MTTGPTTKLPPTTRTAAAESASTATTKTGILSLHSLPAEGFGMVTNSSVVNMRHLGRVSTFSHLQRGQRRQPVPEPGACPVIATFSVA